MENQIQPKMSRARQFMRHGSFVPLLMIGALLVAVSALLPIRDVLNALTPNSGKEAPVLATSETSQVEAAKVQWQLAKSDPAILKALQDEWLDAKEKFSAEFGVVARQNAEAAVALERLDEWKSTKHDLAIMKVLQEEWRAVKQEFDANFGAALAKTW